YVFVAYRGWVGCGTGGGRWGSAGEAVASLLGGPAKAIADETGCGACAVGPRRGAGIARGSVGEAVASLLGGPAEAIADEAGYGACNLGPRRGGGVAGSSGRLSGKAATDLTRWSAKALGHKRGRTAIGSS